MSYLPLPVVPASLQAAVGQLPVSVLLCASLEAVLFATHAQVSGGRGPHAGAGSVLAARHLPPRPTQPPAGRPPRRCPPSCRKQVLLALGPSRSFKELKDRRWYFLIDLLSPWAALVAAASTCRSGAGLGWAEGESPGERCAPA